MTPALSAFLAPARRDCRFGIEGGSAVGRQLQLRREAGQGRHHFLHDTRDALTSAVDPAGLAHELLPADTSDRKPAAARLVRHRLEWNDADAKAAGHHGLHDLDVLRLGDPLWSDLLAHEKIVDRGAGI